jgi:butyrate kinase
MFSYLNTKDAEEVSDMLSSGRVEASRVIKAMVYQIAKEIGSLYAITKGNLDAIIITGGLAYNQDIIQPLIEMIEHLGELIIYPGENELESLAFNMHAYLTGIIEPKHY